MTKRSTLDPTLPAELRSALSKARRQAARNGHMLRPWQQEPSAQAGQTIYLSACKKCSAHVTVAYRDGAPPQITPHGTELRTSHPA